ncbi:MAG TPA: response regulator [Anaerolineales bacterium]|nr:response regulator [Anaerolineales bacterium]
MKRIWIVDDDEEMNRAIGLMLNMLDCEVMAFQSARATAQTLLTGKRPDLMVLDINMPEVSGLDLLEFIRRRKEWKDLPVIMLSSEASDTMVDRAMQMGADSYLIKPITIEELEKAMEAALQKRESVK